MKRGRSGVHILHLIQPDALPDRALHALSCLSRFGGCRHGVLLLGGSGAERRAQGLGVATFDRIHAPERLISASMRAVNRFIAARPEPELVCAWSAPAARLARRADSLSGCAELVVDPGSERWPIETEAPHVAPRSDARGALREEFGIEKRALLIGALDDPGPEVDGLALATLVASASRFERHAVGVVPRAAKGIERGLRLLERLEVGALACVDAPTPRWLSALDTGVVRSRGRSSWADHAAALRIPVIEQCDDPLRVAIALRAALRGGAIDATPKRSGAQEWARQWEVSALSRSVRRAPAARAARS